MTVIHAYCTLFNRIAGYKKQKTTVSEADFTTVSQPPYQRQQVQYLQYTTS